MNRLVEIEPTIAPHTPHKWVFALASETHSEQVDQVAWFLSTGRVHLRSFCLRSRRRLATSLGLEVPEFRKEPPRPYTYDQPIGSRFD